MKLSHPFFSDVFDFKQHPIHTMVIESPSLLRSLMRELLDQFDGCKGEFLLADAEHCLDIDKTVECITDLMRIEPSQQKRLCTAIQKELAEIARHELSAELLSLYARLHQLIDEAVHLSGMDVEYDEVSDIAAILKLFDLRPSLPDASLGEKLLLYMDLCTKYLNKKMFIILHLHAFLSREEIALFCKNAVYQKTPLLLVEGYDVDCSVWEKKHVIDADMCEI